MKCIAWLASYPKSGNTWLRIFLANYLTNGSEPVSINRISHVALGDSLVRVYEKIVSGFDPSDEERTVELREAMLRSLLGNPKNIHFIKTHNINADLVGQPLIPPHLTRSAVYVVRNPLDLVLSYASHYNLDVSEAVLSISSQYNRVTPKDGNVTQYLGNWSDHVRGWSRESAFPVHTVRYEDMTLNPKKAFTLIVRRLGLPFDKDRLAKAIEFSSFKRLKAQEDKDGFIEKSTGSDRFFRSGTAGQWQDALDKTLLEKIVSDHGKMMKKYDYLPR